MLRGLMTDKVTLLKNDGQKYENIPAHVQPNLIIINDTTIPVEEGDKIIRILPSNMEEIFVVLDRGFYPTMRGLKAHFQIKVKRENSYDNRNTHTNVNNFYGSVNNTQIQQNVRNSSQTISINEDYDMKEELSKYVLILKENIDKVGLESENLSKVTRNVEIIENELKNENTKSKVIKECLTTIRNVLEGVAGSLIASGLIYQMANLIK